MKHYKIFILLFLTIVFITSCRKEITFDTGKFIERPVIEGYIENGDYPWVLITKNQAFFEPMNLDYSNMNDLMKLFIIDATVIVSNGVIDDTLVFGINPQVLQGNFTWPPVRYQGSKFLGVADRTYTLTVIIDDKTYTSTTTITTPVLPDSVWFVADPQYDTLGAIFAKFRDNPNQKNYYKYFTKRFGKDSYYIAGSFSLWEDSFFNGREFQVFVMRGTGYESYNSNNNSNESAETAFLFHVYDTVSVKVVTMDNNSFQFWRTLGGNAVETNIEGGALGVWCGYGAYYCDPLICLPL